MMNRQLGKAGEDLAVKYLQGKYYRILERNFRTAYGEIDIICEVSGGLVFVEVKTRRSQKFGLPQEAVTPTKIRHLKRAAYLFLDSYSKAFKFIRFDVVAITILSGQNHIEHIESAF
jgi:putative endonuclease